jgi:beta-lactamase class C
VVVRHDAKTEFFPYGEANRARRIPVTPDSIFELASITKVFTTTSLAIEVEEGRMRLGDPVDKYLPMLQKGGDIRRVTLEQLATHTSSLPRTPGVHRPEPWNRRLVLEWLERWHAPYPPGTKSLYSNLALGVLGFAIAAREDEPLYGVFERQFLRPLDMQNTFFEIPERARERMVQGYGPAGRPVERSPNRGWPGGGYLCSSGRDMAQFLTANLGERPDRPAITKAMQLAQQPYFKASERMVQGLCWQRVRIQGKLVIDKNGGLAGTSTYIGMIPERKLGVVVMANRGKSQVTKVGRQLLLKLVGATLKDEPRPGEEEMDADGEAAESR